MDKYNATGRVKKAIDIILGLLFIALLGIPLQALLSMRWLALYLLQ